MTDQFKVVTTKSWISRITSSLSGILIGTLLFFGSFFVLYINEGTTDFSKIAQKAVQIEASNQVNQPLSDQIVAVTGTFTSTETLGDTYLQNGNYIFLDRIVEMYSWEEVTSSKSKNNTGGSETTETTYTYEKKWSNMPATSASFKYPENHYNPEMPIDWLSQRVSSANLGVYSVNTSGLQSPKLQPIQLNNQNLKLDQNSVLANDQYIYIGKSTFNTPEVGDLRISYIGISNPIQTATVLGAINQSPTQISTYNFKDNETLYRVFEGTKQDAISTLSTEYKTQLWIFRGLGLLMMWIGLTMIFSVISVLLDFFPILGHISRSAINGILFLAALILSISTILVSMILHNIVALIITILIVGGIIIVYLRKKNPIQK
jgi:hypothetical protein